MSFVVLALVVLALTVLFNMFLTFAILRKLRNGGMLGTSPGELSSAGSATDALVGRRLPDFAATTVRGEAVRGSSLSGSARVIGFFTASCSSCREQAERFARHDDLGRIAFVVMDSPDEADHTALLTALDGTPTIVAEPASMQVAATLGVRGYPQLLALDARGTVVDARHSLSTLRVPA